MTIADIVRAQATWAPETTLLDFGCGFHGSAATQLCELTAHTVAVDSNAAVIAQFNRKCADQGLSSSEIEGVLATDFFKAVRFDQYFDIAVASLVWHHIPAQDRASTAAQLAQKIKPRGMFILIDVDASKDRSINGVSIEELENTLHKAGFIEISVSKGPRITLASGKKTRLLVAKGFATGFATGFVSA